MGARDCYVCDQGIKFFCKKGNYFVLYSAPDWRLHYFNSDRKTIYSADLDQWAKSTKFRMKFVSGNYLPDEPYVIKALPRIFKGHKIQNYVVKSNAKRPSGKGADEATVAESKCDVAEEIIMPPKVSHFVALVSGQPIAARNYPADITVILGDGQVRPRLQPVSIEKTTVPEDFFHPPVGYKPVTSDAEITMGSGLINDMVQDLGADLGKP